MGVSSDMRSSRVRRQAAKKPNKERTVQVRFSDEELAALDAICSEKKMTRSAFLRSCVEKVQSGDAEPTYRCDEERRRGAYGIRGEAHRRQREPDCAGAERGVQVASGFALLGCARRVQDGSRRGARRAVEADR